MKFRADGDEQSQRSSNFAASDSHESGKREIIRVCMRTETGGEVGRERGRVLPSRINYILFIHEIPSHTQTFGGENCSKSQAANGSSKRRVTHRGFAREG